MKINNEKASIFTAEQEQELANLKRYRPCMIVWGAVKNNDFEMHATPTRHKLNRYLRNGWLVAEVELGTSQNT